MPPKPLRASNDAIQCRRIVRQRCASFNGWMWGEQTQAPKEPGSRQSLGHSFLAGLSLCLSSGETTGPLPGSSAHKRVMPAALRRRRGVSRIGYGSACEVDRAVQVGFRLGAECRVYGKVRMTAPGAREKLA